jgi:hypothetical protein
VSEKRVELMASNDSAGASCPKARRKCIPSGHGLRQGQVVADLIRIMECSSREIGFPRLDFSS